MNGFGKSGIWLVMANLAVAGPPVAQLPEAELRVIAALPQVPAGLNRNYEIESVGLPPLAARFRIRIAAPRLKAAEWSLFAAQPPQLPTQRVLHMETLPRAETVQEESPLHRGILRSRFAPQRPEQESTVDWQINLQVALKTRHLLATKTLHRSTVALRPDERLLYLRATTQCDHANPAVAAWVAKSQLVRRNDEGEVNYARRVFLHLKRHFTYEYLGEQDRRASAVCGSGKSDCGGLSQMFVTVLRSQGIAARVLAGRWAVSAVAGARIGQVKNLQQHVRAEFFAQGVGWVPVDLATAILHDKSSDGLRCFGHDNGDFITLHVDGDLVLDVGEFGRKNLSLFQDVSYWAVGTGNFDGVSISETWNVVPVAVLAR